MTASGARYEPVGISAAERAFLADHPDFDPLGSFAELRRTEYARLDRTDQVYLDYTGGGLHAPARSTPTPNSSATRCSATRTRTTRHRSPPRDLVERARRRVLDYFNAAPDEYLCVFTANASARAAARRRGLPVRAGRSVRPDVRQPQLGQRHPRVRPSPAARAIAYVPVVAPDLRLDRGALTDVLGRRDRSPTTCSPSPPSRTSPASSIRSTSSSEAHDARMGRAARCRRVRADQPARPVGLARPDFVTLSFYKMFGFPTGVGCLLIRKDRLPRAPAAVVRRRHRSRSPRCRATATTSTTTRPASRTARSTTSTCRRSRRASITSSASAATRSTAGRLPHGDGCSMR